MRRNVLCFLLLVFFLSGGPALADGARVIVLPFAINAAQDLAYLEESLPKLLRERLQEKGFSVVSAEETEKLIRTHQIDYLDLGVAKDMALLSNAQYAVYGSFSQIGRAHV